MEVVWGAVERERGKKTLPAWQRRIRDISEHMVRTVAFYAVREMVRVRDCERRVCIPPRDFGSMTLGSAEAALLIGWRLGFARPGYRETLP